MRKSLQSPSQEPNMESDDSAWEDDDNKGTEDKTEHKLSWNSRAEADMKSYRRFCREILKDEGADDDDDDYTDKPNVQFYKNMIYFSPEGVYIKDFHENWYKDYNRLEYVHSYIQWLFPIQEKGMNYASHELSPKEIKIFQKDEEIKGRVLQSYKIMLDFYGIELDNEKTGQVKRAENWKGRFRNLNRNTHNNLRITRILKSLGLLGFRHYQKPLVHFFLEETLKNGELPWVKRSVLDYFMFTVIDKDERKELIQFAFCLFKPKEEFVWCPRRIRNKLLSHPNEGVPNSSQDDQNDLMNTRVEIEDELDRDTEDTSIHTSTSESRYKMEVSAESQETEQKSSFVQEKSGDANEAASGVESQPDSQKESEDTSVSETDDKEAKNNDILNFVPSKTEGSDEESPAEKTDNQQEGNKVQNQSDEMSEGVKDKKANKAEDKATHRGVNNTVTSHSNDVSKSDKVTDKEFTLSEPGTTLSSDLNSSPLIPARDAQPDESSEDKSVNKEEK